VSPAVSKKQQAYMAIAEHTPDKLRGPMPQMTHAKLHDFAATPTKGLPTQVAHPRLSTLAGPAPRPNNLGHYQHPRKVR
jgi:hypothetical protein